MGSGKNGDCAIDFSDARWKDVKPIYHSAEEDAVVRIAYSERFKEVFAYLRALMVADERSERALQLTTEAVELNPANYTAWQYRRNLLKSLDSDISAELSFLDTIIAENPKNYQLWHHRRVLVEWLNDGSKELAFTSNILNDDAKNYHAWQHSLGLKIMSCFSALSDYCDKESKVVLVWLLQTGSVEKLKKVFSSRQWVVSHFKLWDSELAYSVKLLGEDLRNNSAWNYRYFIISNTGGYTTDVLDKEIQITKELIKKAPHNESAWNYLGGILMDQQQLQTDHADVWTFCEELYKEMKSRSPFVLSFMVDWLADSAEKATDEAEKRKFTEKADTLLDELVQLDPIRREYWKNLKAVQ